MDEELTINWDVIDTSLPLRDQRQMEFANIFWNSNQKGILLLAPRFGKCYVGIDIMQRLPSDSKILIGIPDNKIKISWEEDFESKGYSNPNITFSTHISLHKYQRYLYDFIIIDELHKLSKAQVAVCKLLFKNNKRILGLTGTLSEENENTFYNKLKLPVIAEYKIEKAVEEGIVVDYNISIIQVPLDVYQRTRVKDKFISEKTRFNNLTWVIGALEEKKKSSMFMRLARMRIIQKSISKLNKTKELLVKNSNERILVFCGTTATADSLGIPSYHSKSKNKQVFKNFADGIGNQLAVVKIGNTGVTYKPLDKVIINYFSSSAEDLTQCINRCMSLEYNNPDKKAQIYIITTNEEVELKWLSKALEFFDKTKINFL
jgi:superfamily II DNA or RNA helicase